MPQLRASWYSQLPPFGWFDPQDRPGSNALGVPDWQQGIALPSRRTLGRWFNVTPPGERLPFPMQQTDTGPAPWTGRGVDISAAAAHQMGYTPQNFPTNAAFTVEPRDEPRALGSPAGLPVQAGDLPDNAVSDTAYAGPARGRRTMPSSLFDMFTPTNLAGDPTDLAGALQSRQNSLLGLGLGLMSSTPPGENAWANALKGFQAGASTDAVNAYRQALIKQHATDLAFRQEQAKIAQANWEKQFARGEETDFGKVARDLGIKPGTPEYTQAAKTFYQSKTEGDWSIQDVGVDQWNRPIKKWVNKRTMEERPIGAGTPTDAFAGGVGATPGYYGGGPFGTGTGAATTGPTVAGAAATSGAPKVTLPNGQVVEIPPGMDAKTFIQHISQNAADVASGKLTEVQSNAQLFANRMEHSEPQIQKFLTAAAGTGGNIGRAGEWLPIGGEYLQTPQYQQYARAKLDWITAQLRKESGAAINRDEYIKSDRTFFPQPGDDAATIAAKNTARAVETEAMKRVAGPGYKKVEVPEPAAPTSAAPASGRKTAQPPPKPPSVPPGSAYSPSLNQWRSPSGQLYDAQGAPL